MQEARYWIFSAGESLVLLVDDRGDVRRIRAAIALCGDVEWLLGVLREAAEEELEERVDVLARDGSGADGCALVCVREADVDGLVEKDDVGVGVPGVLVIGNVGTAVGNGARAELEEKTGGGRTARTAIKPEHKRCFGGVVSGLKEPGIVMK